MTEQAPTVLYLAWQDAVKRSWFVVGRLRRLPDQQYEFVYTQGYAQAREQANMQPILGFMETRRRYLSTTLFPLFQNRLMSRSRAEYPDYIERLGLGQVADQEPLLILARSGGRRVTDSFEVFPAPISPSTPGGSSAYVLSFFIHGLRHVPEADQKRASQCAKGESLFLMADWQNPTDANSIMIRTEDNHLLGWLPRYYCADVIELRNRDQPIKVTVERVNPPSSPPGQRVLCCLAAPWPEGFNAFAGPEYQPLAAEFE